MKEKLRVISTFNVFHVSSTEEASSQFWRKRERGKKERARVNYLDT